MKQLYSIQLILFLKTFRHSIYVLMIVVLYCFINLALNLGFSTLTDARNWQQWCYGVRTVIETFDPCSVTARSGIHLVTSSLWVVCSAFSSQLLLLVNHYTTGRNPHLCIDLDLHLRYRCGLNIFRHTRPHPADLWILNLDGEFPNKMYSIPRLNTLWYSIPRLNTKVIYFISMIVSSRVIGYFFTEKGKSLNLTIKYLVMLQNALKHLNNAELW